MAIDIYEVVSASSATKLAELATAKLGSSFAPLGVPTYVNGVYHLAMVHDDTPTAISAAYVISVRAGKDPVVIQTSVGTDITNGKFPFGGLISDDEGNLVQFMTDNMFVKTAGALVASTATSSDIIMALRYAGLMGGSGTPD